MSKTRFVLKMRADLDNLTNFQPSGGFENGGFLYFFKVRCTDCDLLSKKEMSLCVNNTVRVRRRHPKTKKTKTEMLHLERKCPFCGIKGYIELLPGRGKPYTLDASQAEKFLPLMVFECEACEPLDFDFAMSNWEAFSLSKVQYLIKGDDFVWG